MTNAAAPTDDRFPHLTASPVPYRRVSLRDDFWAPRQRTVRDTSVAWLSAGYDPNGGLEAYAADPDGYTVSEQVRNMESIKFIESMATVVGIERDALLERMISAWVDRIVEVQGEDGYLLDRFPVAFDRPPSRWEPAYWSHEDYTLGHYIEAAIALRDATGDAVMFDSAVRAADEMVRSLGGGDRPYTSGHPVIERALMRLYAETGETAYVELCRWLLDQRGHHEGRESFGRMRQDDVPLVQQRVIQGHAVMAAYLYNGATDYVAATGDPAYRATIIAVWDDMVQRRMYLHGAAGNVSSKIEGYRREPYCILPEDCYGESCSAVANFTWSHRLFQLTGEARFLDVAERILYNAFPASIAVTGDAAFYENPARVDRATPRSPVAAGCCPPNITRLISTVGGFLYATDAAGVYVNHYAASEADIAWGDGLRITQRTAYPWDGGIELAIEPPAPVEFALRLRIPAWVTSATVTIDGEERAADPVDGWLTIRRTWSPGDRVALSLPMEVRRATLPPEFRVYHDLTALERGPIVYCLEEQDLETRLGPEENLIAGIHGTVGTAYLPEDEVYVPEFLPEFLGGVVVLRGEVRLLSWPTALDDARPSAATFVPYGVWDNREPGPMRIWLGARPIPLVELSHPDHKIGESCIG